MKKILVFTTTLIIAFNSYAADRQALSQECLGYSKSIGELVKENEQPLKCQLKLIEASSVILLSSQLIKISNPKPATLTIIKSIQTLGGTEQLNCVGQLKIKKVLFALYKIITQLQLD